jgi:hypothetical protein
MVKMPETANEGVGPYFRAIRRFLQAHVFHVP